MPEKLKHTVLRIFMETRTFLTPPFRWFHTYLSKFPKFQPRLELSNIFPNIHRSVVNIFNGTNFPRAIPRAKRLSIAGSDAAEVGKKAATRAAGNAGGRRVPIDAAGTGMRSQGRNFMFAVFFFSWMDGEWRGGLVWFEGHRFTTSFSLRLFHGVRTTGTSYESHNCQILPPPFTVATESSSWPRYFVVYSNNAVRTTAWNFHGSSRDYFTARLAFVSLSLGWLVVSCFNENVLFVK